MFEYVVIFIIAFAFGYGWCMNQHISSVSYKEIKDEDTIASLRKKIQYYKKLTKTLVDENMEFRRKQ